MVVHVVLEVLEESDLLGEGFGVPGETVQGFRALLLDVLHVAGGMVA